MNVYVGTLVSDDFGVDSEIGLAEGSSGPQSRTREIGLNIKGIPLKSYPSFRAVHWIFAEIPIEVDRRLSFEVALRVALVPVIAHVYIVKGLGSDFEY